MVTQNSPCNTVVAVGWSQRSLAFYNCAPQGNLKQLLNPGRTQLTKLGCHSEQQVRVEVTVQAAPNTLQSMMPDPSRLHN